MKYFNKPLYCCGIVALLFYVSFIAACTNSNKGPGAGVKWTNYPSLAAPTKTKTYRWLVIKCQLSDVPTIPPGLDASIVQFFGISGAGYGNLVDYFHDVSYNHASVIADKFLGWISVPISKGDVSGTGRLAAQASRKQRVLECLRALPADQLSDLDEFYGVVIINNSIQDGGAASVGPSTFTINNKNFNLASVWFDPKSLSTEFAAHEMLHGLGLDHSYDESGRDCGARPGEYCDPWDIMSAQRTYQFVDNNFLFAGGPTGGGPGLNAPGLLRMDWIPVANQRQFDFEGGEQVFKIRALSRPRGTEPLVVIFDVGSQLPFEGTYTIEYRQGDGWDLGFVKSLSPSPIVQASGGTVLVHQYRRVGAPASTLINGAFAAILQPCNTLVLNGVDGAFHVSVLSFDIADGSATVSIGFGKGRFMPCGVFKNSDLDGMRAHQSPGDVIKNPDTSPAKLPH